jgi:hypothetical protein
MRDGLVEFAQHGGKTVILICTNQTVTNLFRLWVGPKQGLELRVVADFKAAVEMSRHIRGTTTKPPPLK